MSKSHSTKPGAVRDQYFDQKSKSALFEDVKLKRCEHETKKRDRVTKLRQGTCTCSEAVRAQSNLTEQIKVALAACNLTGDIQNAACSSSVAKKLKRLSNVVFSGDRLKDPGESLAPILKASHQIGIKLSHRNASPKDQDWLEFEKSESGKKNIGIGPEYQALIPEKLKIYDDVPMYENEDILLWDPSKLAEEEVQDYLKECLVIKSEKFSNRIPSGSHMRDNEKDLYLLLQSGYNKAEALRRKRINALSPNYPMTPWSQEECKNFENGIIEYGKNFHKIQNNLVKTRTVKELVHFYYLWKKTERHDILAAENKIGKKKYAFIPGCTNYMDRYLDGEENKLTLQNCSARWKPNSRAVNERKTNNVASSKTTSSNSNLECTSQNMTDTPITFSVKKEIPE